MDRVLHNGPMGTFLPGHLPWGSRGSGAVPLPPFATAAEHDRFTRLLQLHVALVDDGGPSLAAKVLSAALTPSGERSSLPTALELQAALGTCFPVPWTPAALAGSLSGVGRHAPRPLSGGRWSWDFDPEFTAVPREGGGWVVERHERGSVTEETLEHDGDLVLVWMDHFSERHSYPYGWRVEDADAAALAEGARAARERHAADTRYPYLARWRAEREDYLGG